MQRHGNWGTLVVVCYVLAGIRDGNTKSSFVSTTPAACSMLMLCFV